MEEPNQQPNIPAKRVISSVSPQEVMNFAGPNTERADEMAKDMRAKLQTLGLESAWRLNKYDLALATLNAGSDSVAYTLPRPPGSFAEMAGYFSTNFEGNKLPRSDSLVVKADRDWLLFKQVIWYALTTGQLPQDKILAAREVGFVPIRPEVYTSYLDSLQAATRLIESNLHVFIESGAWLAAETNTQHQGDPLGAPQPFISIIESDQESLTFSIGGAAKFTLPVQSGGSTLIAGAGYSTVSDINILSRLSNRTFLVNDNDPLIAALWNYHLQLVQPPNIQFSGGDFGRLDLKVQTLSSIVISDTPSAEPRSIYNLFRAARSFPNCIIVSLQRFDDNENIFSADRMRLAVEAFGFTPLHRQHFKISSNRLDPSKELRSMDGTQAEALLRDPPPSKSRRYELLIAKVGR